MQRSVLVGVSSGTAEDTSAVASELAVLYESSLTALYIEDTSLLEAAVLPSPAPFPPEGVLPLSPQVSQELQARFQSEEWILGQRFLEMLSDTRLHGRFRAERGEVTEKLMEASRSSDVLVVGKCDESRSPFDVDPPPLGAHVEPLIRQAYCPVCVVPPAGQLGDQIIIAYDGSAEAQRSLRGGCSLGERLGAQIRVLIVGESEDTMEWKHWAEDYLETHAISADVIHRPGHAAPVILDETESFRTPVLVMGAFGHGRLTSLVGGAATHPVLSHVDCVTVVYGPNA